MAASARMRNRSRRNLVRPQHAVGAASLAPAAPGLVIRSLRFRPAASAPPSPACGAAGRAGSAPSPRPPPPPANGAGSGRTGSGCRETSCPSRWGRPPTAPAAPPQRPAPARRWWQARPQAPRCRPARSRKPIAPQAPRRSSSDTPVRSDRPVRTQPWCRGRRGLQSLSWPVSFRAVSGLPSIAKLRLLPRLERNSFPPTSVQRQAPRCLRRTHIQRQESPLPDHPSVGYMRPHDPA